jgi:multimeric flavodoxin WrbA
MKRILGLTSSPRKGGNGEIMTKEIALNTGSNNRLEILRLLDLNVEPCKACYSCMIPGKKCPRDDDMEFLFHKISEADGVIISSPVYNWGITVGIRRVFDRAFLFDHWVETFADKPCVTFVTYGVPYEEGYALSILNEFVRQLNLRLKDNAAFLGSSPGEVLKYEENMETARILGQALFDDSYKRKVGRFECPNCFSNIIKFRSEMDLPAPEWRPIGKMECAFCGTVAEIRALERGIEVIYRGKGHYDKNIAQKQAKFHEATIKSFAKERENVEKLKKRYDKLDVKIVSVQEDI